MMRKNFVLLAGLLLLLAGPLAWAAPERFGSRTLQVPPPAGFVPVAEDLPRFFSVSAAYLPEGNRLVQIYLRPADRAAMIAGRPTELGRYFQMQVMRSIDGQPISPAEFTGALSQVEAGIVAAANDLQRQTDEQFQRGNQELQQSTGTEAEISLTQPKYHGIFRREPWGLFFTLGTRMQVQGPGGAVTRPAVAAAGMVLVDQQVLYLYAYAMGDDPAGRRWAEQQVSAWADAVLRANAPRPEAAPTTTSGKRL